MTDPTLGLAQLCHEIDTPLGVAVTAASVLSERVAALEASPDPASASALLADLRECAALLETSLARAADLVADQRRALRGAAPPTLLPMTLAACLREATQVPLARNGECEVDCVIDCPPDLQLFSDPLAWTQVITNLMTNSMRHGFRGRSLGRIDIRAETTPQGRVQVHYRDDGHGLAPQQRAQLFSTPFAGPFASAVGDGASGGLGLLIVRDRVEQCLLGTIVASSSPEGLSFIIDVPLAPPAPSL